MKYPDMDLPLYKAINAPIVFRLERVRKQTLERYSNKYYKRQQRIKITQEPSLYPKDLQGKITTRTEFDINKIDIKEEDEPELSESSNEFSDQDEENDYGVDHYDEEIDALGSDNE
jgi:hypothetical protein